MADTLMTVVIAARNAGQTLPNQLRALLSQNSETQFEILICDNGSKDRTREVVYDFAKIDSRVRYIDASRKQGAGFARSMGILNARGELIIFCDADDIVSEGWIRAYAIAYRESNADLFCGRLVRIRRGKTITETGLNYSLWSIPFAPTSNCAITRTVYQSIGPFDSDFKTAGEDIEYFWSAQLHGFQAEYVPEAVVKYSMRDELWDYLVQQYKWGQAQPRLYRRFRTQGMPRTNTIQSAASLAWNILGLITSSRETSRRHAGIVALYIGRLTGSIRARTLFL